MRFPRNCAWLLPEIVTLYERPLLAGFVSLTTAMNSPSAMSLTKVQSADMRPLFMLTGAKTGLSDAVLAPHLRSSG